MGKLTMKVTPAAVEALAIRVASMHPNPCKKCLPLVLDLSALLGRIARDNRK